MRTTIAVTAAAIVIGTGISTAATAHADDSVAPSAPVSGQQTPPPPADAPIWTGDYDDGDIWIVL